MFCTNCGKEFEIGQHYCIFCGKKLQTEPDEDGDIEFLSRKLQQSADEEAADEQVIEERAVKQQAALDQIAEEQAVKQQAAAGQHVPAQRSMVRQEQQVASRQNVQTQRLDDPRQPANGQQMPQQNNEWQQNNAWQPANGQQMPQQNNEWQQNNAWQPANGQQMPQQNNEWQQNSAWQPVEEEEPQEGLSTTRKVIIILAGAGIVLVLVVCAFLAYFMLNNSGSTSKKGSSTSYGEVIMGMFGFAAEDDSEEVTEEATEESTEDATEGGDAAVFDPLPETDSGSSAKDTDPDVKEDPYEEDPDGDEGDDDDEEDSDDGDEEEEPDDEDVDAESDSFVSFMMEEDEKYSYDIDGDGSKEEIYFQMYTDFEDSYGCEIYVYVDGTCVIDVYNESSLGGGAGLCDFESGDGYREIYLTFYSDSDCFVQDTAYRYQNGAVETYYNISCSDFAIARWSLDLDALGSGIVCYDEEFYTQYLGQGYAHRTFRVSGGKLSQIKTHVYDVTDDWRSEEYHATITLPFLTEAGGTETDDVISPGDCFYLLQVYTQTEEGSLRDDIIYLNVLTEDGRDGWIAVPNEEFFEENSWRGWG